MSDAKSGVLSQSRIDDAVTRILRVKIRAGLWKKLHPSARALAGQQSLIGCSEHRATARQPIEEIGAVCAHSILNLLSGERHDARLPPIDLIVRESTKSIYR